MTTVTTCEDLLDRVHFIADILVTSSSDGDKDRRLSDHAAAALTAQGFYKMLLPRALGGDEVTPMMAMTVWEAIARYDGAAAWNVSQGGAGLLLTANLSPAGTDRIFDGSRAPVFAGSSFPRGGGMREPGGYRISGQISFASGCHHADWFYMLFDITPDSDGGSLSENTASTTKIAFVPRRDAEIIDSWHTVGMRGTGSHDVSFSDVFVPDDLIWSPTQPNTSPNPAFQGALYKLGNWPVINGEAVTALGIAQAAISEFCETILSKIPTNSATRLADRELVQANLGRARALVESARAYLHDATARAYTAATSGRALGVEDKISLQLANCHVAEASARAVSLVVSCAGSTAIRCNSRFQQHLRDTQVILAHATKSEARYASAGKLMFGMGPDAPHLF